MGSSLVCKAYLTNMRGWTNEERKGHLESNYWESKNNITGCSFFFFS